MSILKPWTPVETKKIDGSYKVSVLNRTYTLDKEGPLFSSVISCGEELLAAPMRIVAENKGEKNTLGKPEIFRMKSNDEDGHRFITTIQSDIAVFNISHNIEYDGCDEITLSIMPTGRSVAACFGLEKFDRGGFDIDKLYLEVPLNKSIVKYYNLHCPTDAQIYNNPDEVDATYVERNDFAANAPIPPSGIHTPFLPQIYLNGDNKGLGLFFESHRHFENDDSTRVFEVLNQEDCILLRIRFFDKTPEYWLEKGPDNKLSRDLLPIIFHFGMQVTPVKTQETYPYSERSFHVDCFKKTPGYYDEFLSKPVIEGHSENGFDRIKRLGVDTLYLHEKWNDIQNNTELTIETDERLKYIVEQCHKRGIRVIPYFGYEISTLSQWFQKYGDKYLVKKESDDIYINSYTSWYRFPYQRAIKVCYGNEYGDIFSDGIIALQKEYGFDGFYFDATAIPRRCANHDHGCGYIDSKGVVRETVNHFALRKMFKKIYKYAMENNLIINAHVSTFPLCDMGFTTSYWIGENIQGMLMRGEIDSVPEGHMMAKYSGRDVGVPTYTLCYSNEMWSFEKASGIALLYGSIPKPVDISSPLEHMSRLWQIMDNFPMDKAKWLPYYNGNTYVTSASENVKISLYMSDDKILAICTAMNSSIDEDVEISAPFANIADAYKEEVLSDTGKAVIHFSGFETKILLITK